jgi:hypothetical protein
MKRISRTGSRKGGAMALARSSRRALLTLFCLLAFSLQSYIAQTHIHIPGTTDLGISALATSPVKIALSAAKQGKRSQLPINSDTTNCPLCQTVLHAGFFLTPALLVLLLPDAQAGTRPAPIAVSHHNGAPSHTWHSRGPPQL